MIINSQRCLIRPFKEEDIDDLMVYRNDMAWMRYQGFKGLTKQEYTQRLVDTFSVQKGGQLAIISTQTNKLIGDIYLKQENDTFWIGYTICPSNARQGYAYEAVSAVISEISTTGAVCIKAGILPENAASLALLKKLNFEYLGTDGDEQIFLLDRKRI